MSAMLLVAGILLCAASGVPGLFLRRGGNAGERIATALLLLGCASGAAAAVLSWGAPEAAALDLPWAVPGGRILVRIDGIAAIFLVQVFLVAGLGSVYGLAYFREANHPRTGRKLRLFYGFLTAGLAGVMAAGNSVLFLASWEVMALSAFFLVTTEDADRAVREAGYIYLAATRAGTLCLFAFFALLYAATDTFDFGAAPRVPVPPRVADALFVLGLLGFGLKAGVMPLHVWLPGAHASAPTHVSALMSGVLIKAGIYGLVRVSSLVAEPPAFWGAALLLLGATSGVLGVAFALGQHDIKRLLAYHSVENIGIIVMGLGLSLLGRSLGAPDLAVLGMAGALLHVWNHGLFKALLFFAAGAVVHTTGTREIDRLGGLAKTMPKTAVAFLLGAVAICGLPPLNGFVSEYLLYVGLLRSAAAQGGRLWLAGALGAPTLALIGALAVACFVKAHGSVFLGTPRDPRIAPGRDPNRAMLGPMAVLAAGCLSVGLAPTLVAPVLDRAVLDSGGAAGGPVPVAEIAPLGWIGALGPALLGAVAVAAIVLSRAIRRGPTSSATTWGCGYAAPAPSMQYTSSSFASTLVNLFAWALRPVSHAPRLVEPFPGPARLHTHVPEVVLDRALLPAARALGQVLVRLRRVQSGNLHAYVAYVLAAVLVSLVVWR